MDTQTTALTAIITSLVFLASPEPRPEAKMTEAQAAMSIIEDSTKIVDRKTRKLRLKTNERSAPAVLDDKESRK
tara:strand:- start:341 stop:562 length:222 start_codon:yes stop_codon:yes gene_type:complete